MLEFTTKPTKEEDSSNTTTWAKDFESQMKGNISHLGHTERCNCLKEALQVCVSDRNHTKRTDRLIEAVK